MSNVKNETMDTSTVCEMFEEVKVLIAKQLKTLEELCLKSASVSESAPTPLPKKGRKSRRWRRKLDSVSEKLSHPLKHHHTLDFMGNRALIALVVAIGALFVSL